MIIGIGTDIVLISRITDKINHKILSEEETKIYMSFSSEKRKQEFLAGRFAIKEAIIKAFNLKSPHYSMTELCVLNDGFGKPYLFRPILSGEKIWLSISHESTYAIGLCVIEEQKE
ncbi:MAG: holo-ACP synthase [Firmicutes bacterium]|nr:holo-ACP synthase [Bacillota bacterium]